MDTVTGIFETREQAEQVLRALRSAGISAERSVLLAPGTSEREIEKRLPITDFEGPGVGAVMGGTVGGAVGAAAGASLGLAAASLVVPGVGPVMAIGALAGTLLGVAGAVTGVVAGESLEQALGTGLPHEDVYLYEEALRRRRSVVVALVEEGGQSQQVKEIMTRNGSLDLENLRESWWKDVREKEREHYQKSGRDFERDELSYRRGFNAALHPSRRGKQFAEVEPELRASYGNSDLDSAFQHGYERGFQYHLTMVEIYKA